MKESFAKLNLNINSFRVLSQKISTKFANQDADLLTFILQFIAEAKC